MRLWDYPSISMFSPDLSSTVKWSSQTMIRSSQRFTRDSSKAVRVDLLSLMKLFILLKMYRRSGGTETAVPADGNRQSGAGNRRHHAG